MLLSKVLIHYTSCLTCYCFTPCCQHTTVSPITAIIHYTSCLTCYFTSYCFTPCCQHTSFSLLTAIIHYTSCLTCYFTSYCFTPCCQHTSFLLLTAQSSSVSAASNLPCRRYSAPKFLSVVFTVGESTLAALCQPPYSPYGPDDEPPLGFLSSFLCSSRSSATCQIGLLSSE